MAANTGGCAKKKLLLFCALVFCISLFPLHADDFTVTDAEPYDERSTPQWVKDMRRTEIITLGSWPFTLLTTAFGLSLAEFVIYGFDASYIKNPFMLSGDEYSFSETTRIIFTSIAISVGIGAADLITHIVKRKKAVKNEAVQFENITITPLESQQDRMLIFQNQNSDILFGNLESAVF